MAKPNFSKITESLQRLINIKHDCDAEATINNISESSEFKGLNVWILVFAIFLASIGLNVNSTAVIIGAMLVSPLMGPIMGIGLAIGISDLKLLKKSLKNLLVMTLISLLVSSLYFFVTPLSDAQSELLARTRPTIFDVLIASFGGFAGIVASSRKQEKTTVVSGVAIATALMPPLCTAGYGLGTGQINYFLGAFYLFFINSFFIALATFLIIKYLEFPEKEYMDENRRKKVRRTITVFSLIVIIPSVFMAINVIKETAFNSASIKYISDLEQSERLSDVQIIKSSRHYEDKKIELAFVGKTLTDEQKQYIQQHLIECGLDDVSLNIKQSGTESFDLNHQSELIQNLLDKKDLELTRSDSIINTLQKEINTLQDNNKVNMSQLATEIQALYPDIQKFEFGETEQDNMQNKSTQKYPTITLHWNNGKHNDDKLNQWLKARLNDTMLIIKNE